MVLYIPQLIAAWLLAFSAHGCVSDSAPVFASQDGEAVTTRPAADESPESAEALLDLLESDAADLRDFQALVHYRKYNSIFEETEWLVGDMIYQIDPEREHPKRFAILFRKRGTVPELRDRNEHYIFDGVWLVEKHIEEKQFIKRQIVAPGEEFDPLKLGEGPFPMPIGQKKIDVLSRFDAVLIDRPVEDTFFGKNLSENIWGLELTPKEGTAESRDYERIEIYYDRDTLLPAGLRAFKIGGDRDIVLFLKRRRNEGVDESLLDTRNPGPGWRIQIDEWQDRERAGE